jgi:hypothetical protein
MMTSAVLAIAFVALVALGWLVIERNRRKVAEASSTVANRRYQELARQVSELANHKPGKAADLGIPAREISW